MTTHEVVIKGFPVHNMDRVDVLNNMRDVIGPLVPAARRLSADTAAFQWIDGVVPSGERDMPDEALPAVGAVLARLHACGRAYRPGWGVRSATELPGTVARLHAVADALGIAFDLRPGAHSWAMTWTHGDVAPANVVFDHDWHVVGVIDWEFMAWDSPILDVAHGLWRMAGWSNWRTGKPDWARRSRRTGAFLRGYGWSEPLDDVLIALRFLLERRIEVIAEAEQRDAAGVPPDWIEERERCLCDIDSLRADLRRFRKLPSA